MMAESNLTSMFDELIENGTIRQNLTAPDNLALPSNYVAVPLIATDGVSLPLRQSDEGYTTNAELERRSRGNSRSI